MNAKIVVIVLLVVAPCDRNRVLWVHTRLGLVPKKNWTRIEWKASLLTRKDCYCGRTQMGYGARVPNFRIALSTTT
jgi:hypothetical protein